MTARSRRIGAALLGSLAVGLTVGVVVAAPRMTAWGGVDHAALVSNQVNETVVPSSTTLWCPGAVNLPQGEGAAAAPPSTVVGGLGLVELTPGAHNDVVALGGDAAAAAGDEAAPLASLTGVAPIGVLAPGSVAGTGPWAVRGSAATQSVDAGASAADKARAVASPAQPVGAVGYHATSGDLRGLAAASCAVPSTDEWIVAGETVVGQTATLALDNPGRTTVTATVDLWGAAGKLTATGTTTYVIPAYGHHEVLLSTLAPEERRLVLHVTTTGGAIGATVAESRLDGAVPRGVMLAMGGGAPAKVQVVPGVSLGASDASDADAGDLRLLAPKHDTTVTVRVLGEHGREIVRGAETVDLVKGEVTDVSLAGVRAGAYTVVVSAAHPILAGVRVVHPGANITESSGSVQVVVGTSADVAWLSSSTLVRADTSTGSAQPMSAVAVPAGVAGYVVLGALPVAAASHLAALDDVPVSYGDGAADPRQPVARGTVVAYDAAGTVVGSSVVTAALGQTVSLPLATLAPGAVVAAVVVTSAGAGAPEATASDGVDLVWTLLAADPAVVGSIAALAPRYPERADRSVTVRASDAVGR